MKATGKIDDGIMTLGIFTENPTYDVLREALEPEFSFSSAYRWFY
jgi:hypothetical protein